METTTTGRDTGIDSLPPMPSMSHNHSYSHQQHHRNFLHVERPSLVLKQSHPPSTRSLPVTTSSCLKQTGSLSRCRRQLLAKAAKQSSSRSVTFDEDAVTVHTIKSASSLSSGPKSDLFYSPRELEIMQENSIQREEERRYQEEQRLMYERKAQRARRKAERKAKAERKSKRRSAAGRSSCSEEDASYYSVQSLPVTSRAPSIGERGGANQRQSSVPLSARSGNFQRAPLAEPTTSKVLNRQANRIVQIYDHSEVLCRTPMDTLRTGQVPSMHRIFPSAAVVSPSKSPVSSREPQQQIRATSSFSSSSSWCPPSQLDGARSIRNISTEEERETFADSRLRVHRARYDDLQRSLSRHTIQLPPPSRDTPRRVSPRTLPDARPSMPSKHHSLSFRSIQLPPQHQADSRRPRHPEQPLVGSNSCRASLQQSSSIPTLERNIAISEKNATGRIGSTTTCSSLNQRQDQQWLDAMKVGLDEEPRECHSKSPSSLLLLGNKQSKESKKDQGKKKLWHRILCKGKSE